MKPQHFQRLTALPLAFLALALALAAGPGRASTITLTGTVRDFNSNGTSFGGVSGHDDFQNSSNEVRREEQNLVRTTIGSDNKPVYANNDSKTVRDGQSFYQWFHDDSSRNRSEAISLVLNQVGTSTTYAYNSGLASSSPSTGFFPVDGRLLNQQSRPNTSSPFHNYGFTVELHSTFNYLSSRNDFLSVGGDDDIFVFINGILATNLSRHGLGNAPSSAPSVALNSIATTHGLVSGRTYNLAIFKAERERSTGSSFSISTSMLTPTAGGGSPPSGVVPEPGTLALLGVALAGLGAGTRRLRHGAPEPLPA